MNWNLGTYVDFGEGGPEEKPLKQGRESSTTNSTHMTPSLGMESGQQIRDPCCFPCFYG
jgi:hypothetical protein